VKGAGAAAAAFGDLDAHHAEVEQLVDEVVKSWRSSINL
jgi:hypothetical protein